MVILETKITKQISMKIFTTIQDHELKGNIRGNKQLWAFPYTIQHSCGADMFNLKFHYNKWVAN